MSQRKRTSYRKQDLEEAVLAYKNKEMTSVEAAKKYRVPESTIRRHKSNPAEKIGAGRPNLLNDNQEQYLVALIKELEQIGVRTTKSCTLKIVGEYISLVNGGGAVNTSGKFQKEQKLERSRKEGFTEEVRVGWFDKLESILTQNNLLIRPGQIYNADESGFADSTQCETLIVSKETITSFEQAGGSEKQFTTALICCNAVGEVMPPFIIYAAKSLTKFGQMVGQMYIFSNKCFPLSGTILLPRMVPNNNSSLNDQLISPIITVSSKNDLSRYEVSSSDDDDNEMEFDNNPITTKAHGYYKRVPTKSYKNYSDILNLDDFVQVQHAPTTTAELYIPSQTSPKSYTNLIDVDLSDLPPPMSPKSAVRSIITNVVQQTPQAPLTVKPNNRIRAERKFGEEITNENLLDQLKQKEASKLTTKT
ncbi:unnamed protein product [Didymodactylos carnosus]|uniref:HTH psq-type domain-containing protein n=1 Tax=Didymodactylos carnosus TaxID=1234261 RepID=A0A8S2DSF0_9BILA|nr:unnamed protein product [Didymodactylos carnosus]CAF3768677.1 unnamed protein product [Didymodactylos carnosus]